MAHSRGPAPLNVIANTAQSDESWKSDYFINWGLPTSDGGLTPLDPFKFKMSNPTHKRIVEWIQLDPEKNIKILLQNLVGNFRSATKTEAEFDFMDVKKKK